MRVPTRPVPGVQHFHIGVRVEHRIYGQGTVIDGDRYTRGDMVRVRFDRCGEVRIIASRLWEVR